VGSSEFLTPKTAHDWKIGRALCTEVLQDIQKATKALFAVKTLDK
jgi:hypothetical protein